MKIRFLQLTALVLSALLIFSGCGLEGTLTERLDQVRSALNMDQGLTFSEMEYVRPDMEQLDLALTDACTTAQGEDLDAIMDGIYGFYDEYDWFYTMYCLADIYYSQDLTDSYWEEEYYFCVENSAAVDAGLEELYYALAKSPCREELEGDAYFGAGFFDSYDGENNWDETFTAMLEQEAELQNRYYDLSEGSLELEYGSEEYYDAYADDMAQVLVDLIALRQEIAGYWGYDNYVDFAWDFYYYRDYTPREMEYYLAAISEELVPLYREMALTNVWDFSYDYAPERETMDYVRQMAENMGGTVEEAFQLMESRELYDISYGENKYSTSFEVYLTSYQVPFVFVAPNLEVYDRLVFAHEFGHFCNDYASYGSIAGVDVLEVFSQGMEYLSLCYSEDSEALTRVKLADGLSTYVEQAAFADFERQLYGLSGEELSVQGLYELYDRVALEYGFDSVGYDPREFITISHFYTNPMYIVSYVVSNDAALQLYQLELQEPGKGLERFEENLATQQLYFLSFLQEAELTSPFAEGQLESIRDLFRQELLS